MINEANEYTMLSADSDVSHGEIVLTDADLASVLGGGEESLPFGGDGPAPISPAEQFFQFYLGRVINDASGLLRIPFIQSVLFPPRPIA